MRHTQFWSHLAGTFGVIAVIVGAVLVGSIAAQPFIFEPSDGNLGPFALLSDVTTGTGPVLHCWNSRIQPRYVTLVITWGAWPTPTATATSTTTPTPTATPTPTNTATPTVTPAPSGGVQFEVSDDPNFAGTWAPFGSAITVAGVYTKTLVQAGAPVQYLRARVSTGMGNGQRVSVTALLVR